MIMVTIKKPFSCTVALIIILFLGLKVMPARTKAFTRCMEYDFKRLKPAKISLGISLPMPPFVLKVMEILGRYLFVTED